MNKFFNIWLLFIAIISIPFTLAVGLNEDFHFLGYKIQGEEFIYKKQFFLIIAGLAFLLGALKASKKWMGIKIVKQTQRFKFSTPISKSRIKRVLLYNLIELVFFLLFGLFFSFLSSESLFLGFVFFILFAEHLLNTIQGIKNKRYRVAMTSKALLRVDREISVIYFKGLEKIATKQQTLYFHYNNDLLLHLPLDVIPEERFNEFISTLKSIVDPDKVYFENL